MGGRLWVTIVIAPSGLTSRTRVLPRRRAFFSPFQKYAVPGSDVADRVDNMRIYDENGEELWMPKVLGVNVIGYDAYKKLTEGFKAAADRSVCSERSRSMCSATRSASVDAKKEQCSFHMSGTEAAMGAALRACNTGGMIVTFAGAYHGWYDGAAAGHDGPCRTCSSSFGCAASTFRPPPRDRCRAGQPRRSAAANKPPPADFSSLQQPAAPPRSRSRPTEPGSASLPSSAASLALCLFDEVYVGFRYSRGGAQQFFGAEADVVLRKTLGGGLPAV